MKPVRFSGTSLISSWLQGRIGLAEIQKGSCVCSLKCQLWTMHCHCTEGNWVITWMLVRLTNPRFWSYTGSSHVTFLLRTLWTFSFCKDSYKNQKKIAQNLFCYHAGFPFVKFLVSVQYWPGVGSTHLSAKDGRMADTSIDRIGEVRKDYSNKIENESVRVDQKRKEKRLGQM